MGIGAKILGAELELLCFSTYPVLSSVTAVDVDQSAITIAQNNCSTVDVDVDFIRADVFTALPNLFLTHPLYSLLAQTCSVFQIPISLAQKRTPLIPFHTVLMNPPFGTRNAGADVFFLRVAAMVCFQLHAFSFCYFKLFSV